MNLDRLVETDEFRAKLQILEQTLARRDDEYARLHLGNWVGAHNSVLTAAYCFLVSDGIDDAVVRAIRMGGDTDTIAAMTGALAGARHGIESLPPPWKPVEGYDPMVDLADAMLQRIDP